MSQYPYTKENFPLDETHLNDLLNYNTRFFSNAPAASYSFHYAERKKEHQR